MGRISTRCFVCHRTVYFEKGFFYEGGTPVVVRSLVPFTCCAPVSKEFDEFESELTRLAYSFHRQAELAHSLWETIRTEVPGLSPPIVRLKNNEMILGWRSKDFHSLVDVYFFKKNESYDWSYCDEETGMSTAVEDVFEFEAVPPELKKYLLFVRDSVEPKAEEKFLIWDQSEYSGNSVLWWRPNRSGYTTDLDQAGRYTLDEALKIERLRGTDVKVPESVAKEASGTVVDAGRLREVMEKARAH